MKVLATCHVHSNWSYDGSWSLESLSEKFQKQGCQVLMMTEHDKGFTADRLTQYREACAKASSEKILVVPGIEYSDAENRVHVLVWGPVPFLGENLPTGEMLNKARAADGLAVFAHSSRREAWKTFEPAWADQLLGIEVWNRKYDGWAPSTTAPAILTKTGLSPFVGLDFHTQRQSFPLTMALDVDGIITEENVLKSLRLRRCTPQFFGRALSENRIHSGHPILNLAEKSRRALASFARRSKTSARMRDGAKKS
jgi:hypothetical protein